MNQDAVNLRKFICIYKNISEMEKNYYELEEFGATDMFSFFFDAYFDLSENLQKVIDLSKLTEKKAEEYEKLNINIYKRLKGDYPRLYAIAGNIDELFAKSYKLLEDEIKTKLESYEVRPFFTCGFSFFNLSIPKYSLLYLMLKDGLVQPDNFVFSDGKLNISILNLNSKFNLSGQEYELYDSAYKKCIDFLNKSLSLNGTVNSYIN